MASMREQLCGQKYEPRKIQTIETENSSLTCCKYIVRHLVPAYRLLCLCDKYWRTQVLTVYDNVTLQINFMTDD